MGARLAVGDVVLKQALGAVVGEALGELDDGDEEGRGGQGLADAAEGALLVVAGLVALGRGAAHLGVGAVLGHDGLDVLLLVHHAVVHLSLEAAGEFQVSMWEQDEQEQPEQVTSRRVTFGGMGGKKTYSTGVSSWLVAIFAECCR